MRKKQHGQEYTLLVMKEAEELSRVTEEIIKEFIATVKPEKSESLESLLTEAERNSHLANEATNNYGNDGSKRDLDFNK